MENYPPLASEENRPVFCSLACDSVVGASAITNAVTIYSRECSVPDESGMHEGMFQCVTLTMAEVRALLDCLERDAAMLRECSPNNFE